MNDYITVKLDRDTAYNMLYDRLDAWGKTQDPVVKQLFADMYESYIDEGVFDGCEFDPMVIVDNDVVNYCTTLYKSELKARDWKKLVKAWDDGDHDVSCEKFDWGRIDYIEAMNETEGVCLVR